MLFLTSWLSLSLASGCYSHTPRTFLLSRVSGAMVLLPKAMFVLMTTRLKCLSTTLPSRKGLRKNEVLLVPHVAGIICWRKLIL